MEEVGTARFVSSWRRPTYFPWVFTKSPKFFVGPLTTRVRDRCTKAKPPQSCFWMTIICFDAPQIALCRDVRLSG